MNEKGNIRSLHPLEIKVLLGLKKGERKSAGELVVSLDMQLGQVNQGVSRLLARGVLTEVDKILIDSYELTELGRLYLEKGLPETWLYALSLKQKMTLEQIRQKGQFSQSEIGSAFGSLRKAGALAVDDNGLVSYKRQLTEQEVAYYKTIRQLLARGAAECLKSDQLTADERQIIAGVSKKRSAGNSYFKQSQHQVVVLELSDDGIILQSQLSAANVKSQIGRLTPEILATGEWRQADFRPYDVDSAPVRQVPGRKNPYSEYIQTVKDKMAALGFSEMDGPLIESEFWNGDALYMPQFHAARDIHDVYYIKEPTHIGEIEQPWLDNIAAAHENGGNSGGRGWGYNFDRDFTRRLLLRSQGTVLSAKQLPKAQIPGKYFAIVRCFRHDQVDATHGADFYQTEGIVLGEEVNLRHLLGLLKMFAVEVAGAENVKFAPAYFPFTEPSIEVHVEHPKLGWFELGGSGIFRPEVTQSLGITTPVLAWGLGIDRMAMMQLKINDIRELFSNNIEAVRLRRS